MGQQQNKEVLTFQAANNSPWIYLLQQDIQWSKIQQKVESAALLSPEITQSGFYICPANTSSNIFNHKVIPDDIEHTKQVNLTSQSLDSFISEYIDLIKMRRSGESLPKIVSIDNQILKEVNAFLKSRGSTNAWSMQQYIQILNFNLVQVTTPLLKDALPANDHISIELLYGMMISHYGEEILLECPQIAVLMISIPFMDALRVFANKDFVNSPPKIRKLKQLTPIMNLKKNLPVPKEFYEKSFESTIELSQELKKIQKEIQNDWEVNKIRKCPKKSYKRLRNIIIMLDTRVQVQQEKYEVRKEIVSEHLSFNEDYRLYSDKSWEVIFYEGLSQALNRLPTDIGVYNNSVLRDVNKHLVTRFLKIKNPALEYHIANLNTKSQKKLEYLATVVRNARKLGYFVSDWQNKLARKWSKLRAEVMKSIRSREQTTSTSMEIKDAVKETVKDEEQSLRIPPPIQYCLALDLNPEAHPFSFTYGRQQGYCIDYASSLQWYYNSCNKNEKSYFYSLLQTPSCHDKFVFLNEIPEEIRSLPQPFNSQKEVAFVERLDKWLAQQVISNPSLELIKHINTFIDGKINALPQYLQDKTRSAIKQRVSTLSLFDSIFNVHFPEEVYLDKTILSPPVFVEITEYDQIGIYNQIGQNVNLDSQLLGFWGPPRYGGKI